MINIKIVKEDEHSLNPEVLDEMLRKMPNFGKRAELKRKDDTLCNYYIFDTRLKFEQLKNQDQYNINILFHSFLQEGFQYVMLILKDEQKQRPILAGEET